MTGRGGAFKYDKNPDKVCVKCIKMVLNGFNTVFLLFYSDLARKKEGVNTKG